MCYVCPLNILLQTEQKLRTIYKLQDKRKIYDFVIKLYEVVNFINTNMLINSFFFTYIITNYNFLCFAGDADYKGYSIDGFCLTYSQTGRRLFLR